MSALCILVIPAYVGANETRHNSVTTHIFSDDIRMPTNDDDNDKTNNSVARLNITQWSFRGHGEGRVKWAPYVTAFLGCNVVKATVVVSTDTPGGIAQRLICFFGTNAKR